MANEQVTVIALVVSLTCFAVMWVGRNNSTLTGIATLVAFGSFFTMMLNLNGVF